MNHRLRSACAIAVFLCVSTPGAEAQPEYRQLALEGDASLDYAVQLPPDYDPRRAYPVLLALPPGPQTRAMVGAGLQRYWGEQARTRGWIVVSPEAPAGKLFFRGGERHMGALLRQIRIDFRVAGNRMHLAGASNGGRSAFRVALEHPHEFQTLTVLPGYPPEERDFESLPRLAGISIHMFVGGDDASWVTATNRAATRFEELGIPVTRTILPGEGHVPPSMDGDRVMTLLTELHAQRSVAASTPAGRVALALDDFHDAAAKADEERYFGRLAPDGVFLGTDASERWTTAEFRSWGMRYFQRPSAWIYVPQSRHIGLAPDGDVAWFDEVLGHARFGSCRGSGALRRIDGTWRITQYNLTVPIPNDLMDRVVSMIQRGAEPPATASTVTTIYLVRHAEKIVVPGNDDPGLTPAGQERSRALDRALESAPLAAVYVTQYRRTRDTVATLVARTGLAPIVIEAAQHDQLAETIRDTNAGASVLVCGHSNTLPAIIRALGVEEPITIGDDEYDQLFIVTVSSAAEARLGRLHYGAAAPR